MSVIDDYIKEAPVETQEFLHIMLAIIRSAAPMASEKLSWGMPTFVYHGNLVHFATAKKHIGFYPGSEAIKAFEAELTKYKHSKGAIQFPYAKPLPKELIERIVKYCIHEHDK